jgi:hypothetical protein
MLCFTRSHPFGAAGKLKGMAAGPEPVTAIAGATGNAWQQCAGQGDVMTAAAMYDKLNEHRRIFNTLPSTLIQDMARGRVYYIRAEDLAEFSTIPASWASRTTPPYRSSFRTASSATRSLQSKKAGSCRFMTINVARRTGLTERDWQEVKRAYASHRLTAMSRSMISLPTRFLWYSRKTTLESGLTVQELASEPSLCLTRRSQRSSLSLMSSRNGRLPSSIAWDWCGAEPSCISAMSD